MYGAPMDVVGDVEEESVSERRQRTTRLYECSRCQVFGRVPGDDAVTPENAKCWNCGESVMLNWKAKWPDGVSTGGFHHRDPTGVDEEDERAFWDEMREQQDGDTDEPVQGHV